MRMKSIIMVGHTFLIVSMIMKGITSDSQEEELLERCTSLKVSVDLSTFLSSVSKTFVEMRKQLSNLHFATSYETDVFGMAQCRNYLSTVDCLACYDAGVTQIRRKCDATVDGAHFIYQGCFLRYGIHNFYKEIKFESTVLVCSYNQSVSEPTAFKPIVQKLLTDIAAATPKIKNYFAAAKRQVFSSGITLTVYAAAQCVETISLSDCGNCLTRVYTNLQTCLPQSGGSSVEAGCFLRYSDSSFFADSNITNITPYIRGGSSSRKKSIIGIVGGLCLLFLITASLLWYQLVRKPKVAENGDVLQVTELQGTIVYSFKDLKSATKSFSQDYKIGEGGFGDVYKGIMRNGDVVAVKKHALTSNKAKADFESEVRLISSINHRNVIRLLGCSDKGSELLLVFQYMENGSLDKFLYGEKQGTLTWKQRVDIILGIARGLAYLHEEFHLCIIHRDIKSSNILLDNGFQPKIADFGLARLTRENQSHQISSRYAGTRGYTAPEYAIHGHLTEKVDTFSYGIVVLEIISGLHCTDVKIEPVNGSLLEHAWQLHEDDKDLDLVDEKLDPNECDREYVKKIIQLALMCTQLPASLRPAMSEVVVLLTSEFIFEKRPLSMTTMV
ncbi:putative cysteine-rich receptor-like protein kinase 3-like [Heracleum sosnowskyi]|uniref:Cysteine-rich receptor-like protein kinase 3-like n=1 Tax=Heracleum sosnowskyi TaxID=360622 RepID=A0AAD8I2H2_9APIA|nr:putative cysteine-rich receptor-like protein kinase 3-like [Heracleum sosnowskyi]